jgi:hypothetical protein
LVWHCIVHCLCQWIPTRLQVVTCLYDLAFGIFINMAKHVFAQGFRAKHWSWFNEFVVLHLGRPGPLHFKSSITKRISIHDFFPAKFGTISAILEKPGLETKALGGPCFWFCMWRPLRIGWRARIASKHCAQSLRIHLVNQAVVCVCQLFRSRWTAPPPTQFI